MAEVILASVNFGYLRGQDLCLATLGAQAERHFREDPSTAIIKLRQFAELMAKPVAAGNALYRRERFRNVRASLSSSRGPA